MAPFPSTGAKKSGWPTFGVKNPVNIVFSGHFSSNPLDWWHSMLTKLTSIISGHFRNEKKSLKILKIIYRVWLSATVDAVTCTMQGWSCVLCRGGCMHYVGMVMCTVRAQLHVS